MTEEEAAVVVEAFTAVPYFPSAPAAQGLISKQLASMCPTLADGMWLAERTGQLYGEWGKCGMNGLWQIWFSKHAPKNAKERELDKIVGSTLAYPEGVPAELPALESRPVLALPPGAVASADPEAEQLVIESAEALAVPKLPKYYARTPDEIRVDEILRRMHNETA